MPRSLVAHQGAGGYIYRHLHVLLGAVCVGCAWAVLRLCGRMRQAGATCTGGRLQPSVRIVVCASWFLATSLTQSAHSVRQPLISKNNILWAPP